MKYRLPLLLIVLMSLLVACSPVKLPPLNTYALTNQNTLKTQRVKTQLTLLVSEPAAAPGYETAAMVYMKSPYELQRYANNRWVAPPAQMLMPLLVSAISRQGYFAAVVSPPFAGLTDLRLDTKLLSMQQEFFSAHSRERVVIQVTLVNTYTNRVVASKRFNQLVNSQFNSPYGGVLAANRAVASLTQQIAKFCVKYARNVTVHHSS